MGYEKIGGSAGLFVCLDKDNLFMIWILPYDPFGDDRMLYTVKNMVVENKELVYNDGVVKLFFIYERKSSKLTYLKGMTPK